MVIRSMFGSSSEFSSFLKLKDNFLVYKLETDFWQLRLVVGHSIDNV